MLLLCIVLSAVFMQNYGHVLRLTFSGGYDAKKDANYFCSYAYYGYFFRMEDMAAF
jgi:hypothetical protein